MIYLIVGLSGVGKSTLCYAAQKYFSNVNHIDLDKLISVELRDGHHWSQFFVECKTKILDLENNSKNTQILLVDIGAGFFQVEPECFEFLLSRRNVITVFDKPENIFDRVKLRSEGPWGSSSAEEYKKELTPGWHKLFSDKNIVHVEITNLSEERAKKAFIRCVSKLKTDRVLASIISWVWQSLSKLTSFTILSKTFE